MYLFCCRVLRYRKLLTSMTAKTIMSSSEDNFSTAQSIDAANIETLSSSDNDDDSDSDDTSDSDDDEIGIKSGKRKLGSNKKSKKKISMSDLIGDRGLLFGEKHDSSTTDTDDGDGPADKMEGDKNVARRSKGNTPTNSKPNSRNSSQSKTSGGRAPSGSGKKVSQSKNPKQTAHTKDQTSRVSGKGKTGQPQNASRQKFSSAQARKRILSSGSEVSDSSSVDSDTPLSQLTKPIPSSRTKTNPNTDGGKNTAAQNKRRKIEQPEDLKPKSKVTQAKSHQSTSTTEKPDASGNRDSGISKQVCGAEVTDENHMVVNTSQGENDLVADMSICGGTKDEMNVPNASAEAVRDSTLVKDVQDQEELVPTSPNGNETLPSDLTSSSDKLVINEETSPAVTPTSSPRPTVVIGNSSLPQDKVGASLLHVQSPEISENNTNNEAVSELKLSGNTSTKTDAEVCLQKDSSDRKQEHDVSTLNETKDHVAPTLNGAQSGKSRSSKDAKNTRVPSKTTNISVAETSSKMTLRKDTRYSTKAKETEKSSKDSIKVDINKQVYPTSSDTSGGETDSELSSEGEHCESGKPKGVKSKTFVQGSESVKSDQTSSKPAVKAERRSSQEETTEAAKPIAIKSRKSSQDSKCAKNSQMSSKSNVRTRQSSTEKKIDETKSTGGLRKNSKSKEIGENKTKLEDVKKLKSEKGPVTKSSESYGHLESKNEAEFEKSTAEKRITRSKSKSSQEEKDKPSKNTKSGVKGKVPETKKGAQEEMSKSLRVYKEIYSSSDEYSSEEDEVADDKNQPLGKKADKSAEGTGKKTSKQETREKAETKGKSDSKNKTPSSARPSTTITAKSSGLKKGPLGSYRIPKKTTATDKTSDKKPTAFEQDKRNSDRISDGSVENVPSGSSTPKTSGKLTSPMLTTTKISPLHMTSTCELSPGMINLLPAASLQKEPMKLMEVNTASPGMINLLPAASVQKEPMKLMGLTTAPVTTMTTGNKEERSLSNLLSRCEAMFSNNSAEDKERNNQNTSDDISNLKEPPTVTRLLDPTANQAAQPSALPSVLTGLLAQTVRAPSVPPTTGPSLPPALASLLPGGGVIKPTTPVLTPSNSLPQPLAQLMAPLANATVFDKSSDNTTSRSEQPLTTLPPELARLLPPGVKSVSPTPSQSAGINQGQRDVPDSALTPESASENVLVQSTAVDKAQNSAALNQDRDAEKAPEAEPQQIIERKRTRANRIQPSSNERKRPVVPEKRKVTYKGLSDEERLAAYINCGDRYIEEHRKSQRVDKHESRRKLKKTARKGKENKPRSTEDVKAQETSVKLPLEAETNEEQGDDQDETMESDQQSQEEFDNKTDLSAIDKRSQELNTSVEGGSIPSQNTHAREQNELKENNRECRKEHEVLRASPDLVTEQQHQMENDGERAKEQERTGSNDITTSNETTDDQANIEHQRDLRRNRGDSVSNNEVPQQRRSVETAERANRETTQQGALRSKPGVRRRSLECDRTHSMSGIDHLGKVSSPTGLLPPPKILPDHMITKIPLENSRNAINVHHHDMHNDPRINRCLDSESIYSAGYEMPYALKLPSFVHSMNRAVSEMPKGAANDPRIVRMRRKTTEVLVQPKESARDVELSGSVSGETGISENFGEPVLSKEPLQNVEIPPSVSAGTKISENVKVPALSKETSQKLDPPPSVCGETKISEKFTEPDLSHETSVSIDPPASNYDETKMSKNLVDSQSKDVMGKETNRLLCPEDLLLSKTTPKEKSLAHVLETKNISTNAEKASAPVVDDNNSEPMKSIETKMKQAVEETLIDAPVNEAQFKTVVKASSFGGVSCRESGRASPEAKWIDPRLIRHVASVVKPTPMHRVVVGPPVIKAITTRPSLIKSPAKSKQTGKDAQVMKLVLFSKFY